MKLSNKIYAKLKFKTCFTKFRINKKINTSVNFSSQTDVEYFMVLDEYYDESYINYSHECKPGLNIFTNCDCPHHGFYFKEAIHIFADFGYGNYLHQVYLPTNMPKIICEDNVIQTKKLFLGEAYLLNDINTIKILVQKGAAKYPDNVREATMQIIRYGDTNMLEYFLSLDANKHVNYGIYFLQACAYNQLDVVKYLISKQMVDIKSTIIFKDNNFNYGSCQASTQFLTRSIIEITDHRTIDVCALLLATNYGYVDLVKYLSSR